MPGRYTELCYLESGATDRCAIHLRAFLAVRQFLRTSLPVLSSLPDHALLKLLFYALHPWPLDRSDLLGTDRHTRHLFHTLDTAYQDLESLPGYPADQKANPNPNPNPGAQSRTVVEGTAIAGLGLQAGASGQQVLSTQGITLAARHPQAYTALNGERAGLSVCGVGGDEGMTIRRVAGDGWFQGQGRGGGGSRRVDLGNALVLRPRDGVAYLVLRDGCMFCSDDSHRLPLT